MTGEERERSKAIGADTYLRGKRFRSLKDERIFPALDGAIAAMKALHFPDPYNGHVLAAFAAVIVRNDEKSLGDLRQRKVEVLVHGSDEEREQLFRLVGLEIAERFLAARKSQLPAETKITSPAAFLDQLGEIFEQMETVGREMAEVTVMSDEEALTVEGLPDATNIAQALIDRAIGSYESLVPSAGTDGELPDEVERRAVAKAAFLRLGVDDLAELRDQKGIEDAPTKAAMAKALAEVYADDLQEVARLTLRESAGDPAFGLVTRLLPLTEAPEIAAARAAFEGLRGHYFEVRPAVFFVFGTIEASADGRFLTINGAVRSFSVSPAEVGGQAELNSRPRKDEITIRLQAEQKWATVTARRASDLSHIGVVLRRSGEVRPVGAVAPPDPLADAPYNTWDPRSLWMLDLLRREFQAPALTLQSTIMANFDSSTGSVGPEAEEDEQRPTVESVKLRGSQLQDHPEVCARIVGRAHLKDVEFRLRKVTDQSQNHASLVLVRLAWERDHLAVLSGAEGDVIDADLHRQLVRLVRNAAERPLSSALLPTLVRIEARATETDVAGDAERVLEGAEATPPEPDDGEINLSAAEQVS